MASLAQNGIGGRATKTIPARIPMVIVRVLGFAHLRIAAWPAAKFAGTWLPAPLRNRLVFAVTLGAAAVTSYLCRNAPMHATPFRRDPPTKSLRRYSGHRTPFVRGAHSASMARTSLRTQGLMSRPLLILTVRRRLCRRGPLFTQRLSRPMQRGIFSSPQCQRVRLLASIMFG
jgi:hypothetical protein